MDAPADILTATQGKDVMVFDGECVLCNGWVQFALKFDRHERLHFVIAQSELGEMMFEKLGLKSDDYDTFILIHDGQVHTSLDGLFAMFKILGWPWRVFNIGRILPKVVKDWAYQRVARNRYKIFGRRDTCMIPTPEVRARFIGEVTPAAPTPKSPA